MKVRLQIYFRHLPFRTINLSSLLLLPFIITNFSYAADTENTIGLTNFAFSSYLGTGFYTTSNQEVFVLQLPFQHEIIKKTESEAGWVLNLPVTLGVINLSKLDVENIPKFNDVTTITFMPGIEYQYPVKPNWTLIPFADYGFARDLNNTTNVLVIGAGIKSYADFIINENLFTLGNRFLYAREHSKSSQHDSDYSLIETGLNYRLTSDTEVNNGHLYTNLYYINYYYPNNLVFFDQTENPIRVGMKHEIGFTFSNLPDFLFFDNPEIGFGIQKGDGITVYRLVFGAPF